MANIFDELPLLSRSGDRIKLTQFLVRFDFEYPAFRVIYISIKYTYNSIHMFFTFQKMNSDNKNYSYLQLYIHCKKIFT